MRKIIPLTLLSLSLSAAAPLRAQDGLFTDLKTDVTAPRASQVQNRQVAPADNSNSVRPLPGMEQLREMLLIAGYSAKAADEGQTAINVQGDGWAATLTMQLVNDRSDLLLTLRLSERLDASVMTQERLLKLMQVNAAQSSGGFALSEEGNRLSLRMTLDNREMSVNRLRNGIESLRSLADKNQDAWMFAMSAAGNSNSNAEVPKINAEQSVSSPLVGKWIGSRTKEDAFALLINSNGTFQLAIVSKGQNKKSQGQFTLSGGELTLTGTDGTKLAGTVQMGDGSFDLILKGTGNAVSKLSFRKAK